MLGSPSVLLAVDIKWRELWVACVFTRQREGCIIVCRGSMATPVSSSDNCVDCVFKSYKASFVKESVTYIGSV